MIRVIHPREWKSERATLAEEHGGVRRRSNVVPDSRQGELWLVVPDLAKPGRLGRRNACGGSPDRFGWPAKPRGLWRCMCRRRASGAKTRSPAPSAHPPMPHRNVKTGWRGTPRLPPVEIHAPAEFAGTGAANLRAGDRDRHRQRVNLPPRDVAGTGWREDRSQGVPVARASL